MSQENHTINTMLLSLNTGMPTHMKWNERSVYTGYIKKPSALPLMIRPEGIDSDGQADLNNHGGPDKAVCVYSADHYPWWSREMDRTFDAGAFGENFTVSGLLERDVCIGDVYQIGSAIVQVSQPRQPCFKLAAHLERQAMIMRVRETGYSGFYFRVLESGMVSPGNRLEHLCREGHAMTIAECNRILYDECQDTPKLHALLNEPALADSLREHLNKRLDQ